MCVQYVTISAKTCIVHTRKTRNLIIILLNHACYRKIFTNIFGPAIIKGSFKSKKKKKTCTILLAWLWRAQKSLFRFCILNSECVTCVCLQCCRCKQNCYSFFGKTATIDQCTVHLRVISVVYLIKQALVNMLS